MENYDNNWNALAKEAFSLSSPSTSSIQSTNHNSNNHNSNNVNVSSPKQTLIDEREMSTFGAFPLNGDLDDHLAVVNCIECSRPVQKSAIDLHSSNCIKMKKQFNSNSSSNKKSSNGKSNVTVKREESLDGNSGSNVNNNTKKRKIIDNENGSSNNSNSKKVKNEAINSTTMTPTTSQNSTTSKSKRNKGGPVDLNSQCGVINAKNLPCSRSLTCKTHSMGAKRSVQGRSKPYDVLVYEFELKRKPELADKPMPRALTQLEVGGGESRIVVKDRQPKPTNKDKQSNSQSNGGNINGITNEVKKGKVKKEKVIAADSWGAEPEPNEKRLPSEGLELDLELSRIRSVTSNLHPKPLAGPTNTLSRFIKVRTHFRRCFINKQ